MYPHIYIYIYIYKPLTSLLSSLLWHTGTHVFCIILTHYRFPSAFPFNLTNEYSTPTAQYPDKIRYREKEENTCGVATAESARTFPGIKTCTGIECDRCGKNTGEPLSVKCDERGSFLPITRPLNMDIAYDWVFFSQ